jgi:tRNA nucleotidyltransferase (CCA-adding enzyme)
MDTVNISDSINRRLPEELVKLLHSAGSVAASLGQRVFLVGGVVRDLLLQQPNNDLDLVTEGDPFKLAEELSRQQSGKVMAQSRFNTVKIRWGRWTVDIAAARSESYSQPGSLPSIHRFCDIHSDLIRRDFAINAMAVYLDPQYFGELIDLYEGREDLKKGLIRVLHNGSFRDDATRIWRAIRYEQRLDFKIEKHTLDLIKRDLCYLETVSGDRIRGELELCLEEKKPERVLNRANELGVLGKIHSNLKFDNHSCRLFARARGVLEPFSPPGECYLALLIYNLTLQDLNGIVTYLKIPRGPARILQETLQIKDELPVLAESSLTDGEIYNKLHRFHQTAILVNMLVSTSFIVKKHIEIYLEKLQHVKTALSGDDLMEMGINPGPKIKETLELLLESRLDGRVHSRDEEIELLKNSHIALSGKAN